MGDRTHGHGERHGTGPSGPGADGTAGRLAPHGNEIVDCEWAADLRTAQLCAGSLLGLLVLVDAAAGTFTAARAVLWSGLALLLFLVLMPPRVTAGEGWLAVRTLRGTHRVRTDRLVAARVTGHACQRLLLRDALGGQAECDIQVLITNPALWHRLDTDARTSADGKRHAPRLAALRTLSDRIDRETALAVFKVSGMTAATDERPAA
ncbi:hypothetical protein ACIHCM_01920 [Streptomyces sp. NPDC052023]|uniref:hypothetical protein n=1 Tax=Streptomyces sp. NPDC052023 TaxID=3365681 RepID=UPI0037D1CC65